MLTRNRERSRGAVLVAGGMDYACFAIHARHMVMIPVPHMGELCKLWQLFILRSNLAVSLPELRKT